MSEHRSTGSSSAPKPPGNHEKEWAFISASSRAWSWQDSRPVTAVRKLIDSLAHLEWRNRTEDEYLPNYEEMIGKKRPVELTILRKLNAAVSARRMIQKDMHELVYELRWRGVTWDVIAAALECTKQTAHRQYRAHDLPLLLSRLNVEMDAARRVAAEINSDRGGRHSAADRRVALELMTRLEMWSLPDPVTLAASEHEPTFAELERRYR